MPKQRGPYKKRIRTNFIEKQEEFEQRKLANWTRNNTHKNWLYLYHARQKTIEAENKFIKTKNTKFLRKAEIHKFKREKLLFEGTNLYEETIEELHEITMNIALELFPEQKQQIGKNIDRTVIQELWDYSSSEESSETYSKANQQTAFASKFNKYLDTPQINRDPTVPLEQLTHTILSEEEITQRTQQLQAIKQEVEQKDSELDLLILSITAEQQQNEQQQQPNFVIKRPVATESFQPEFMPFVSENTRSRKRTKLENN